VRAAGSAQRLEHVQRVPHGRLGPPDAVRPVGPVTHHLDALEQHQQEPATDAAPTSARISPWARARSSAEVSATSVEAQFSSNRRRTTTSSGGHSAAASTTRHPGGRSDDGAAVASNIANRRQHRARRRQQLDQVRIAVPRIALHIFKNSRSH
jgi:hypothetical protein